jgi:hypothetical protein
MSINIVYMYMCLGIHVFIYDQIRADFVLLDENQSSTIRFIEVY